MFRLNYDRGERDRGGENRRCFNGSCYFYDGGSAPIRRSTTKAFEV